MIARLCLLLNLLLLPNVVQSVPTPKRQPGPTVSTSSYNFIGTTASSVDSFKGIAFAQPPIGNLRFAPPLALAATTNGSKAVDYDASNFRDSCFQMNPLDGTVLNGINLLPPQSQAMVQKVSAVSSPVAQSEDCLYLNIQRPASLAPTSKLPVMVWIFGGAFLLGSSNTYDGTKLIQRSVGLNQGIVFVSLNYRINMSLSFGFLPGKQVAANPTTSVNAGLMDQRMALEWIADNIAYFGGDPTKVTLFGESSGAISTAFQILAYDGDLSYKGNQLFRAAIMESGAPIPVRTADAGQHSFDVIAKATNCEFVEDPIACLRAVPYDQFTAATNLLPNILSYHSVALAFLPRTDGTFLTEEAQILLSEGKYNKNVAIISGNQYDEGTILTLGTFNITTEAEVDDWLATVWFPQSTEEQRQQILSNYPQDPSKGSPFDTGFLNIITPQNKRISALVGDIVFQAPRRAFLQVVQTTQPTWSYVSRVFMQLPVIGTFHGSDVLSVFGQIPTAPTAEIQTRWIGFANTLNPNVAGFPNWPEYGTDKTLLRFKETGSTLVKDDFRQAGIAYFESIASTLAQRKQKDV